MAIETQPESAQAPGGREPGGTPKQRSWWLRPAWHTALIGAVIGYALGHWLGNFMTPSFVATGGGANDSNDTAIVLGYAFLVLGCALAHVEVLGMLAHSFTLHLVSGDAWTVTAGDLFIALALVLLGIEGVRALRSSRAT